MVTVNHPNELPANYPQFVVCEGRYYFGHYFMDIPQHPQKCPAGGNVAMLVWRYADQTGPWHVSICFRYYRDDKINRSADRKNWMFGKIEQREDVLGGMVEEAMRQMSGAAGLFFLRTPPAIHKLEVRGDWLKYRAQVEREKPFWLHGGREYTKP